MHLADLAACAVAAVGLAGCVAVDTAKPDAGRAQLVNDLAHRLGGSARVPYTAVYRLPLGVSVTLSQARDPDRAAYVYPGGTLTLTPQRLADCRTTAAGTTCTLTSPPSPARDPVTTLLGTVTEQGLIAPQAVTGLLTATAPDAGAVVTTRDTTIAGENATCIRVTGAQYTVASDYEACVTANGLLGSFTGQVGANQVEASLVRYQPGVAPDAFDLPPGARIVDRRPR